MSDRKMISQLKALKAIKPNENWVDLTKKRVIKGDHTEQEHSHAFLFTGLAFAAVLLLGIFGFSNVINIDIPNIMPQQDIALYDYQVLVSSLQKLEQDIATATFKLKMVSTPQDALELMSIVDEAVENGEDLVSTAKRRVKRMKVSENGEPKGMVYTALTDVENVEAKVVEMKSAYQELQREITEQQIEILRASILTENQRDALIEAEEHYNKGDFADALIKVIEASQIR